MLLNVHHSNIQWLIASARRERVEERYHRGGLLTLAFPWRDNAKCVSLHGDRRCESTVFVGESSIRDKRRFIRTIYSSFDTLLR